MSGLKTLSTEHTLVVLSRCIQCGDQVRDLIIGQFCGERCAARYHLRREGKGVVHRGTLRRLLLKKSNLCRICLEPIYTGEKATIDHIIPTSKGGADVLDNMQIAHKKCNELKGDKEE